MAKKGAREIVGLVCPECKNVNYVTSRNKVNMQTKDPNAAKLIVKKYCRYCKKITLHKETSRLK